jgi:isopentenyl diphosphate isomerase/L-lactate dehydrogenase-like FMN-dependent dehydrogenase
VGVGGRGPWRHVLNVIRADIDVALALTGCTSIAELDRSALYEPMYHFGALEGIRGEQEG